MTNEYFENLLKKEIPSEPELQALEFYENTRHKDVEDYIINHSVQVRIFDEFLDILDAARVNRICWTVNPCDIFRDLAEVNKRFENLEFAVSVDDPQDQTVVVFTRQNAPIRS